ncbi:MAG TPA: hypothetical protein V6D25_19380 [Leptolyngbyaceae cyanobacterium]
MSVKPTRTTVHSCSPSSPSSPPSPPLPHLRLRAKSAVEKIILSPPSLMSQ